MNAYPINLDLTEKQVLIVGGGQVAYRKLRRLATTKAQITLISPKLNEQTAKLIAEANINYVSRKLKSEDITGFFLIIAATNKTEVNRRIGNLAQANDKLVNVVDSAKLSNFTLPAVVNQGDLLLTIATGGNLPALSKQIRHWLEKELGTEFAHFLDLMEQIRPVVKKEISKQEQRRQIFRELADLELIQLLGQDKAAAKSKIADILTAAGIKINSKDL